MQLVEISKAAPGDPAAIKQWAAEDYAISIGLLRECPYHGEPYQPRAPLTLYTASAADDDASIHRIFEGDMRALLDAANRAARRYGERCRECAASEHETFD